MSLISQMRRLNDVVFFGVLSLWYHGAEFCADRSLRMSDQLIRSENCAARLGAYAGHVYWLLVTSDRSF